MSVVCPVCQGAKVIPGSFNAGNAPCMNCAIPDNTGKMISLGVITNEQVRCPLCSGGKTITTMGGMSTVTCTLCCGAGEMSKAAVDKMYVDAREREEESQRFVEAKLAQESLSESKGKAKKGKD